MEDFELPPIANAPAQNKKEASWSATPGEIDQETIKKLKKRITYEIDAVMAVKVVLKETYRQFKPGYRTQTPLCIVCRSLQDHDDFDRILSLIFQNSFLPKSKTAKPGCPCCS